MESWIIDYQIIQGSPAEDVTWERADAMLTTRYRHAYGQMMKIEAAFVDSGGGHTQDVYNFTYTRKRRNIFAIKGASRPNRPILCAKPAIVDITFRGKTEKQGAQLWYIGTDTAKDYLASRWKRETGPGAVHFSQDLTEDYYKQLTSEYRVNVYKRGVKVSRWDKKQADRNEALDLMVYNLAAAYHLGLQKKTANHWQALRDRLNPANGDMFVMLEAGATVATTTPLSDSLPVSNPTPQPVPVPIPAPAPASGTTERVPFAMSGGRISLARTRRGNS